MNGMNERVTLVGVPMTLVNGKLVSGETETRRDVYARVRTVGEQEYADNYQAGIDMTVVVEIWALEYARERVVECRGERHHVIRTWDKGTGIMELHCAKAKGRANG